jgi:hypothetical protein
MNIWMNLAYTVHIIDVEAIIIQVDIAEHRLHTKLKDRIDIGNPCTRRKQYLRLLNMLEI